MQSQKQSLPKQTSTKSVSQLGHFINVFKAECQRTIDRGLGFVVAVGIAASFFYFMPELGKEKHAKDLQKAENMGIPYLYYMIMTGSLMTPFVFIVLAGAYYFLYHFEFSFIEQYKANDAPWPWDEMGREKWNEFLKQTLKAVARNNFVLVHVYTVIDYILYGEEGYFSKGLENWPDKFTFFWQIVFCAIVEDCIFHFGHKLMHHPKLYKYHKVHHMYKTPVAICSSNSHWIDFLIQALATWAGPRILGKRIHIFTAQMWLLVRLLESIDAHSGYEFPWSPFRLIPFSATAAYHDYHHSHNIGNYSTFFTFWDTVFGCNKHFYKFEEEKRIKQSSQKEKEEKSM